MDFTDRVVIITGAAGGIGAVTARAFSAAGARLSLVDLGQEALDSTVASLAHPADAIAIAADVTKEDDVARYVAQTLARFGTIDVFFNNAGIEGRVAPIVDTDMADFDRVIAVNLRGAMLGLKHVLPVLTAKKHGSVINTSSVAGLDAAPLLGPYVASKHAVAGLTKAAALEAAPFGVRVNSIHPSPVNTRMMRSIEQGKSPDDPEKTRRNFENTIPLGRYGESQDIANLVLFLASDESSFITGAQYRIDGGLGAHQ